MIGTRGVLLELEALAVPLAQMEGGSQSKAPRGRGPVAARAALCRATGFERERLYMLAVRARSYHERAPPWVQKIDGAGGTAGYTAAGAARDIP